MAEVFSAFRPSDLYRAARMLSRGGIVAVPFNGFYMLCGDAARRRPRRRVLALRGRPASERLARVALPEVAARLVDTARVEAPTTAIEALLRAVHAVGVLLPAEHGED